jgi:hypothetical protein
MSFGSSESSRSEKTIVDSASEPSESFHFLHSPAAIENPCGNKVTLRRDFLRIAWPAGIITGKGPAAMTISSVANGELKALPANHGIY